MSYNSLADLLGIELPDWQLFAKCRELTPDIFFPSKGDSKRAQIAKNTCNNECTVRDKCLAWIVKIESVEGEVPGIYGGLSRTERRGLKICKYKNCGKLRTTGRFCSEFHREASLRDAARASKKKIYYAKKGLVNGQAGQAQSKPRGAQF